MLIGSGQAFAVDRVWDGSTDNNWQWFGNWSGNAVPVNGDTATIGSAPNNSVVLNADSTVGIDELTVTGGAILNTNGFRLLVDEFDGLGGTTIGSSSQLIVPEVVVAPANNGFDTDTLIVQNGGIFGNISRSIIDDLMTVNFGGTVSSVGTITLGDGSATGSVLNNNGTITAAFLGAGSLTLNAAAGTTMDLDGTTGNGIVRATSDLLFGGVGASNLTINGTQADPFSGQMEIAFRDSITLDTPWSIDGDLVFRGGNGIDAAGLNGAEVTANTGASIQVTQGTAVLNADLTMNGGSFTPANGTTVEFNNLTFFDGGANVNLDADNITFNVNGDVSISQSNINLDGNAGGNNVFNVGPGATFRVTSDSIDLGNNVFDGVINAVQTDAVFLVRNMEIPASGNLNLNAPVRARFTVLGDTVINQAAGFDLDGNGSDNRIIVSSFGSLTINTPIDDDDASLFGGEITNSGVITINDPGASAWTNQGLVRLIKSGVVGAPTPTIAGDTVRNSGDILGEALFDTNLRNQSGGRIELGGINASVPIGHVTVNGEFFAEAGSTLAMELGGASTDQFDRLVADDLDLGGILDLGLANFYDPLPYLTHAILVDRPGGPGVLNGIFGTILGVQIGGGFGLAVTYEAIGDGEVHVQKALLGDANLDGAIGQADLDAVLLNWGSASGTWASGDFNGSGTVGQADLDAVLLNWGLSVEPGGVTPVPEPASLLALGFTGWLLRHRHRG